MPLLLKTVLFFCFLFSTVNWGKKGKWGAYLNCLKGNIDEERRGDSLFLRLRLVQAVDSAATSQLCFTITTAALYAYGGTWGTTSLTIGSCSEIVYVIGGNVLVSLNTSSRSCRLKNKMVLNYLIIAFFFSFVHPDPVKVPHG